MLWHICRGPHDFCGVGSLLPFQGSRDQSLIVMFVLVAGN